MLKDLYFGVQIALLFFACGMTADLCHNGKIEKVYAAVIIIACIMALYTSKEYYKRSIRNREER